MITLVANSKNSKLGDMAAGYRKVGQTCPNDCALLNNGCYAQTSFVGISEKRSNQSNEDGSKLVEFVSSLPENKVFRVTVSGDMFLDDKPDYEFINSCNAAQTNRPDVKMYTYTHGWNKIDVTKVKFALNASCDTLEDVVRANNAGWATVTVVSATETRRRWSETVTVDNEDFVVDLVLCPSQSVGLTCAQCKLCMNVSRPFVVAFAAHGVSKNVITKRLELN